MPGTFEVGPINNNGRRRKRRDTVTRNDIRENTAPTSANNAKETKRRSSATVSHQADHEQRGGDDTVTPNDNGLSTITPPAKKHSTVTSNDKDWLLDIDPVEDGDEEGNLVEGPTVEMFLDERFIPEAAVERLQRCLGESMHISHVLV